MEDVEVELNVLACEKDMILGDTRVERYGLMFLPQIHTLKSSKYKEVLEGEASMMGFVS